MGKQLGYHNECKQCPWWSLSAWTWSFHLELSALRTTRRALGAQLFIWAWEALVCNGQHSSSSKTSTSAQGYCRVGASPRATLITHCSLEVSLLSRMRNQPRNSSNLMQHKVEKQTPKQHSGKLAKCLAPQAIKKKKGCIHLECVAQSNCS